MKVEHEKLNNALSIVAGLYSDSEIINLWGKFMDYPINDVVRRDKEAESLFEFNHRRVKRVRETAVDFLGEVLEALLTIPFEHHDITYPERQDKG